MKWVQLLAILHGVIHTVKINKTHTHTHTEARSVAQARLLLDSCFGREFLQMINGAFENQTEALGEATLKFLQYNYTRKWLFCWVKFMMVIKKGIKTIIHKYHY
jgi:hypothetical protein